LFILVIIGTEIVTPHQTDPNSLGGYDLVGFSAGIDGGMNKGRPNEEDLKEAEEFAKNLNQRI
jgi:hypothetical protein